MFFSGFWYYGQFSGDSYIIVVENQAAQEWKPSEAFLLVLCLLYFYFLPFENVMSTVIWQ